MADLRKKNSTVSAYLLFLVVLLVVAAAAIMLWPVYQDYRKKQTELNDLNARLNDRREESARLNTEVADLKRSPEAVAKGAREKFGLVGDNESVIRYQVPEKAK